MMHSTSCKGAIAVADTGIPHQSAHWVPATLFPCDVPCKAADDRPSAWATATYVRETGVRSTSVGASVGKSTKIFVSLFLSVSLFWKKKNKKTYFVQRILEKATNWCMCCWREWKLVQPLWEPAWCFLKTLETASIVPSTTAEYISKENKVILLKRQQLFRDDFSSLHNRQDMGTASVSINWWIQWNTAQP